MKFRISLAAFALFLITGTISCKKSNDVPSTSGFEAIPFKFGADSVSLNIDNAIQVLKNMPRSCDVTQLGAAAVLPPGYAINPNPANAKDYTKGVTYTVTTNQGSTYTLQITAPAYDPINNPYGIYTAKQLSDIRKGLNDSYVLMNDIQLPDLTAANAAASVGISDYSQYGWYSVGSKYVNGGNIVFRGSLDGQNHVIKNFSTKVRPGSIPPAGIDPGRNGKEGDGLFGYAVRATFRNIGIQLAPAGINDLTQDGDGYGAVGSLAGLVDSSTITNCYVTGNTAISGIQFTGGLIGKAQYSTISKSYAALTPSSGSYVIKAGSYGGGLIGWALFSDITDCYATASIISSTDVGGLIGAINTCNVKTSYASGNVAESPSNAAGSLMATNNIGGLIGTASSTTPTLIQNCYATGAVTGANGTNSDFHKLTRIGGLIGQIGSSTAVSVTYCYASGAVSRTWTNAAAPFLTGGLVGNTPNGVFIKSSVCTNYWDRTTTGQNYLGGGNAALAQDNGFTANGKTSAEMKTAGTYVNWDISSVWNVAPGTNNGYPSLRSINK